MSNLALVYNCPVPNCDLFSRRFWQGISLPNSVEGAILKLPLPKLCAVPPSLQNRAHFEGEKRAKRCQEKQKRGGQQGGKKERRTRENGSVSLCHSFQKHYMLKFENH